MKRFVFLIFSFLAINGCTKDDNPLSGTSWLSTYSSECWWENSNLEGDFSEVLTFDKTEVQSKTLKNGYTYRNNWTKYYMLEGKKLVIGENSFYSYYDNRITNGRYVFYKQ